VLAAFDSEMQDDGGIETITLHIREAYRMCWCCCSVPCWMYGARSSGGHHVVRSSMAPCLHLLGATAHQEQLVLLLLQLLL
jgi:hypothetical protein